MNICNKLHFKLFFIMSLLFLTNSFCNEGSELLIGSSCVSCSLLDQVTNGAKNGACRCPPAMKWNDLNRKCICNNINHVRDSNNKATASCRPCSSVSLTNSNSISERCYCKPNASWDYNALKCICNGNNGYFSNDKSNPTGCVPC